MKALYLPCLLAITILMPLSTTFAQDNPLSAQDLLIDMVGEALVEETTQASEEVRKTKEILDVVLKTGTSEEQEQAQKDADEAEEQYAKAQKKLDTARNEAFAEKCGKSPSEIQAMRDSGMGWGRIAKECGIHPSAAGKGKGKDKDKGKSKGKSKSKSKSKKK